MFGWKLLVMKRNSFLGFRYAFKGLLQSLKTERNFKVQLFLFLLAGVGGLYFNISSLQWIAILGVSGLVLGLELANSAIEKLCDVFTKDYHPSIKTIKDTSAAAVLIAAIFAAIIGALIFFPYLF